jgi:uncharacterized protein (DUF58 family)
VPSLLVRVKSRMFIHSHRKVLHLLDGEYGALVRGRSMDFDDLRAYAPGDEVKDIDWKATARHGATLVKRYVALRRQTVVFVVDVGRNMAARSTSGESKSDIAVMVVGVLGYLALRHGDEVALVAGDESRTSHLPAKASEGQLERVLRRVKAAQTLDAAPSDLPKQLSYLGRAIKRRHIVVVVTDDVDFDESLNKLVRRTMAQHEVVWITVGDADPMAGETTEVADGWSIPAFLREDRALRREFSRGVAELERRRQDVFDDLAISHRRISSEEDVIPELFRLLRMRSRA